MSCQIQGGKRCAQAICPSNISFSVTREEMPVIYISFQLLYIYTQKHKLLLAPWITNECTLAAACDIHVIFPRCSMIGIYHRWNIVCTLNSESVTFFEIH